MRALRLLSWKSEPELVEVPDPTPGPGQVVLTVGGAGACHSDLHLMHDFEPGLLPWGPPFTLGHENAGWVHAVGRDVTSVQEGDAVAVYGPWGCGRCPTCRSGAENYCSDQASAPTKGMGGGLGDDGGMADLMLVPDPRLLVPLPAGLEPVSAAPLTDAGLTPYHAVRRSWSKLPPGSTAVVIGVGGLGHLAVQILKATTAARIIAVDQRDEALELAKHGGADLVLRADDDTVAAIRDATGGHGAEVVIDMVGSDATLTTATKVVRVLGDLTVVGIAGGTLPVSFFGVPYEVSIQTTYWGSRTELVEVLDLAARRLLHPTVTTFPLDQATEAYARLSAGTLEGRAVIVPG